MSNINIDHERNLNSPKITPMSNELFEMDSFKEVKENPNSRVENAKINTNENDDFNDDDYDDDEFEDESNIHNRKILIIYFFSIVYSRALILMKKKLTKIIILLSLTVAYFVYFGFSMYHNNPFDYNQKNCTDFLKDCIFSDNRGLAFLILTIIVFLFIIWENFVTRNFKIKKIKIFENKIIEKYGAWMVICLILVGCVIFLALDLTEEYNLVSLVGLVTFVLIAIIMSSNQSQINFKILAIGILMQFLIGVFLMRVNFGYRLFEFFGNQITKFLAYTNKGSELVFGEKYRDHPFAFGSIPVVIFFGSFINLLYYLGAIQYVILKVSWVVNFLMGTSPTESMNATANIFLGQTEAPLLIKPLLAKMTQSEIFSVMTGGFATVAGSVLAAYIDFGVSANHLVIASLMAAPGALAVSKTIFPETKKTKADWNAIQNLPKGDATNIFEAISIGASNMVSTVGGILSNLIAFTAFFAFLDNIFKWFFSMVNPSNEIGISNIMQYFFWPLAFLMGVDIRDCEVIGYLIGTKIFVNEFVAYKFLGDIIKERNKLIENDLFESYKNGTYLLSSGELMIWNDRSIRIVTYALCGFANVASIGIQIGGLSTLAPTRFKVFSKYAAKAMIAGNITNLISACIAGLLFSKNY